METAELLKKVRRIEIKTRGLSSQVFSGEYHSAFKGRGMAFSEVRQYQPGDDVRTIDWNVTARFHEPFVKVFEEERELTVMLLVDVSASKDFGTTKQLKKDLVTELCAILSFSAIQNNDKIGLMLFSDCIEKFIPPKKGRTHILRIIRELLEFRPQHRRTHIAQALQYLTSAIKKRSIAFVISDFFDKGFETALRVAARKHDVIAVRVFDKRETMLPDVGLMRVCDAETGEVCWIDTAHPKTRAEYRSWWTQHEMMLSTIFAKSGVDVISIETAASYIAPLRAFFRAREHRR
ncbi:MAG: DUF58 domain-containing protein [Bacteroidota bacterium]|nr:DUF58 domain-containing protein [Candidatus Kapabacteria bacterium]MDW8219599.1 DUF58 domain-containing protein [Bacteroidota bacterium]